MILFWKCKVQAFYLENKKIWVFFFFFFFFFFFLVMTKHRGLVQNKMNLCVHPTLINWYQSHSTHYILMIFHLGTHSGTFWKLFEMLTEFYGNIVGTFWPQLKHWIYEVYWSRLCFLIYFAHYSNGKWNWTIIHVIICQIWTLLYKN